MTGGVCVLWTTTAAKPCDKVPKFGQFQDLEIFIGIDIILSELKSKAYHAADY